MRVDGIKTRVESSARLWFLRVKLPYGLKRFQTLRLQSPLAPLDEGGVRPHVRERQAAGRRRLLPAGIRRPHHHGRAVRVDSIKPTLKAPGTKRLKLECDEPLSNFGFNFNLRRYIMGSELFLFVLPGDGFDLASVDDDKVAGFLRTSTRPMLSSSSSSARLYEHST